MLVTMVELLRRRRLAEKYAALWLGLSLLTLVIAAVPGLLSNAADLVGIKIPSNLLFALASGALVAVCVHLACETSRLEDETRRMSEEVAILRLQVDTLLRSERPPKTLQ